MSEGKRISSDITVDDCRLMECSMWVGEENPPGDVDVTVHVELSDAIPYTDPTDGKPSSVVYFAESVDYSDVDEPNTLRAHMGVRLRGVVVGSSPDVDVLGVEARRVAASVMYPQAQAHMSAMAGLSPMGIPRFAAIDPSKIAESLTNSQRVPRGVD